MGSTNSSGTTGGGTKVAEFSVATNRKWTDRSGQQQEKTEWHRIVAWTALADIAEQYLKKGDRVYVEGEIQYRSYEDKDGNTRYVTEINARDLIMLGGREGGASQGGGSFPARSREPAAAGKPKKEESYEDFSADYPAEDDLPF